VLRFRSRRGAQQVFHSAHCIVFVTRDRLTA
jgi:hypothetical protein